MATCVRCNNTLSFFENITHLAGSKVCSACEQQIRMTLSRLQQQIMQEAAHNRVTEQFCTSVYQDLTANKIPPERARSLVQLLQRQKQLSTIRQGHLPIVQVSAILDTDEYAHFETPAIYYKPNKQVKLINGRMIATNKKLYFITPDRNSMKIDWNNVVNVSESFTTTPKKQKIGLVHIQVSKGSGGGHYQVEDPELTVAIIGTAVRLWKRHLVELKANPNTPGIPDHVKAAVFKRDGGRCRQCGYMGPYIEYDHILPRSKGGSNTVENIQLLCRQCNLKKGNRI